jgi:aryl-alcohol dehydrogenase-like predicted oxidoreductase
MSLAQMSMRWILDYPAVTTVITGASRPSQVAENASVSDLPPLSDDLHAQLSNFYFDEVKPTVRGVM